MVGLMLSVAVPEPEEALNVAVSAEPGTDAPEAPPVVADQLVVLFQFPVPPVTQNLAAMLTPQWAFQPQRLRVLLHSAQEGS